MNHEKHAQGQYGNEELVKSLRHSSCQHVVLFSLEKLFQSTAVPTAVEVSAPLETGVKT